MSVIVEMNRFPEIAAGLKARAAAAEHATAEAVAEGAKGRAPVLTGALQASIHAEGNEVVADAVNEQGIPYAVFVEYGTHSHGPAQPFLRPSVEAERVPFEERLKVAVET